jgi:hypothetical protein
MTKLAGLIDITVEGRPIPGDPGDGPLCFFLRDCWP